MADAGGWDISDPEVRKEVIARYYPLAQRIGRAQHRRFPPHVDADDVVGYACEGLIRAVDNYDPSTNVPFEAYAVPVMRGRILDQLRVLDWAPRSLRRKQREMSRVREELEGRLGREPTPVEIDECLGWGPGSSAALVSRGESSRIASLEERAEQGLQVAGRPEGDIGPVMLAVERELRDMEVLEQVVIVLYYFEGMAFSRISSILGISESRASSINAAFVGRLRDGIFAEFRHG